MTEGWPTSRRCARGEAGHPPGLTTPYWPLRRNWKLRLQVLHVLQAFRSSAISRTPAPECYRGRRACQPPESRSARPCSGPSGDALTWRDNANPTGQLAT
jgi:hypothetical protein